MRPLTIIISGFGPYAGKTTIDFTCLGEQSLYLITGDTGAGKTTIFDAITYALYGETGAGIRRANMLRSQYAAPDTPTYVELEFSYGEQIYKIRRNPEYMRPSKRGKDGFTKESAKVELTLPSGEILSKNKEVEGKIIEILGVDLKQFTQIAMICQGDFLKLIHASTPERASIFRRLFHTDHYQRIQDLLREKFYAVKREYDTLNEMLNAHLAKIPQGEEGEFNTPAEAVVLLQQLEAKAKAAYAKERACQEEFTRKFKEATQALEQGKQQRSLRQQQSNLAGEEQLLRPQVENLKEISKGKNQELTVQMPLLIKEINDLEKALPDYQSLSKLQEQVAKLKQQLELDEKGQLLLTGELTKAKTALEVNLKEQRELIDLPAKQEELKGQIQQEKYALEQYGLLRENIEKCRRLNSQRKQEHNAYLKEEQGYLAKQGEYQLSYELFISQQAGFLAKDLQENMPCPVCGSTVHPHLAKIQDATVNREHLDGLQRDLQKKQSLLSELGKRVATYSGQCKELVEKISQQGASLGLNMEAKDQWLEIAQAKIEELGKNVQGKIRELEEIIHKLNRKAIVDKNVDKYDKLIQEQEGKLKDLDQGILVGKERYQHCIKELEEKEKSLQFKDEASCLKAITQLKNKVEILKAEDLKAKEQLEEKLGQLNGILGSLKIIQEKIVDKEDNYPQLEANYAQLEKQQAENTQKLLTYNKEVGFLEELLQEVEQLVNKLQQQEKLYQQLSSLSATANGNLAFKEKISLETYVQTYYLDRILARANTRLMHMTTGQYELIRREEPEQLRSHTGLDLDVLDHYNGGVRSVKTLSGGESFKASLAMALGLADEIQAYAGGIQLDTMFIDEGFGSLDSESLAQAIKVLQQLTLGRKTIGIISHVAELKDKINQQVIVTKDKQGGSRVKIIY